MHLYFLINALTILGGNKRNNTACWYQGEKGDWDRNEKTLPIHSLSLGVELVDVLSVQDQKKKLMSNHNTF